MNINKRIPYFSKAGSSLKKKGQMPCNEIELMKQENDRLKKQLDDIIDKQKAYDFLISTEEVLNESLHSRQKRIL